MCECACEMTARNEIEVLDIDDKLKDRILRKYDDEKRFNCERMYADQRRLEIKLEQKETEIRALVGYIALKEM